MPCSSIQKLCSAGERECVTGHPMMPASFVRPVILIRLSLRQKRAAAAQKFEKLEQRQPENGEMVDCHPGEKLDATSFEAIGADRAQQRLAVGRDLPVDEAVG